MAAAHRENPLPGRPGSAYSAPMGCFHAIIDGQTAWPVHAGVEYIRFRSAVLDR